jgi:glutamyl-tRNA synthetase
MPPPAPIVTRFAPSPTGHLHVGGARTALFCWAFAKKNNGRFMIRIEDTDQARSSEESARGILEDLAWLGIAWDDGPVLNTPSGPIGGDDRRVGPFFQARRLDLYNTYINQLIHNERAYPAFETPEELDAKRKAATAARQTYRYDRAALSIPLPERLRRIAAGEKHVVRFRVPDEPVHVTDEVLGEVKYAAGEVDDFVIRKADGFPTYHFAVVVDDELMGVTHILRAQEHLNNTPRHVALQKALVNEATGQPFRTPAYAHMPLIFNPDGAKMSKRDKAKAARAAAKSAIQKDPAITPAAIAAATGIPEADIATFLAAKNDSLDTAEALAAWLKIPLPEVEVWDFRRNGYLPEAITNFLSLLGWSPGNDLEKFDNNYLAANFSIDRIGKTNARFDRAKLLSFNADAIAALPDAEFVRRWRAWCADHEPRVNDRLDEARMLLVAPAIKPRAKTLRDAVKAVEFALTPDDQVAYDPKAADKFLKAGTPTGLEILRQARAVLAPVEPFDPAPIHAAIETFGASRGLNTGQIAQPLRIAATGSTVSPPLGETLALLGKNTALARIDRCLAAFGA